MTAWLPSVRLATTENLATDGSGFPLTPVTLDGVGVARGNQILVKDQTDAVQNGTWIAAAAARNPMTRRAEMFEPECVVRVSEGTRNGHTQWALEAPASAISIGDDPLPWLRQDVKNYSCASIAELKALWQVLPNANATVAGYHAPGDGGGGEFTFVGTPANGSATIQAGTPPSARSIAIESVTNADRPLGRATITTATDHGLYGGVATNVASVYLMDVTESAYGTVGSIPLVGPLLVKVDGARTFRLTGEHYGVVAGDGATVKYVALTTSAAHGLHPGARLALSGIVASGGALDINGTNEGLPGGVIDATHLSLPVPSTGGTYTPGHVSLVGDDALLVVATNPAGMVGGVWRRNLSNPLSPLWWGAKVDTQTDDLSAYRAMHAVLPPSGGRVSLPHGISWLSDTWRVSKPIQLHGVGGNGRVHAGFRVAPGRIAIRLDYSTTSTDGYDSSRHFVSGIDLQSQILVHGSATGNAFGNGIHQVWIEADVSVRKGDCYIKNGEADPTRYYRAENDGAFGAAEPAWSTGIGDTTDDHGIRWITEPFPTVRVNGTHYDVGDRVYAEADNRFLFICTVEGDSAGSPPSDMTPGDGAGGVAIGSTVTDHEVTWLVTLACGIYVNSNLGTLEYIDAVGFTGAALHMQGGLGADAAADPPQNGTSVDSFRAREIIVNFCGVGVHIAGGDSNGWKLNGLFGINVGMVQPTPDIVAAAGRVGLGGHLLHDNGGGGRVCDLYVQTSAGRPVMKRGLGRSAYMSCHNELTVGGFFSGGASIILGGSLYATETSDTVLHLSPDELGRGLQETDDTGAVTLRAVLTMHDTASVYAFFAGENGDPGFYKLTYGVSSPAGWWAMQHAHAVSNAYLLSTSAAGRDPGPGWFAFQRGYLLGMSTPGVVSTPPAFFVGHSDALRDTELREGERKVGDRFSDATKTVQLVSDGYRGGVPWSAVADQAVTLSQPDFGLRAHVIEPDANDGTPGQRVFRVLSVVGDGKTGLVEPAWDADLVVDHNVTWELAGTTPEMVVTAPGQATIAMAAQNVTLTYADADAANEILKLTGSLATVRTLTLPLPGIDAAAYTRIVRNACTDDGGGALAVRSTSGSSISIAFGKSAIIGVDSDGAFRVTPDA